MASSVAMKLSFILLLLTLFSSMKTQARDSQFFNKASSTTTPNVVPNQEQPAVAATNKEQSLNNNPQEEPNFLPQNDNGYGLYSHESGQLPPSATGTTEPATSAAAVSGEPLHKYLPKNYNPVAYVTQPENIDESSSFSEKYTYNNDLNNKNNYDTQYYYNNQAQQEYQTGQTEYRSHAADRFPGGYGESNFNYNGGSSFNSGPQVFSDDRFPGEHSFDNGAGEIRSFQPQGMSDTRSLENGKYFYDVGNEKFTENHPYEAFKERNYYGNRVNSMGGYQNQQYQYQNQQNFP